MSSIQLKKLFLVVSVLIAMHSSTAKIGLSPETFELDLKSGETREISVKVENTGKPKNVTFDLTLSAAKTDTEGINASLDKTRIENFEGLKEVKMKVKTSPYLKPDKFYLKLDVSTPNNSQISETEKLSGSTESGGYTKTSTDKEESKTDSGLEPKSTQPDEKKSRDKRNETKFSEKTDENELGNKTFQESKKRSRQTGIGAFTADSTFTAILPALIFAVFIVWRYTSLKHFFKILFERAVAKVGLM